VYEHSARGGARGVILSQPLGPTDPRLSPSRGPAALPPGSPQLSHFLGGPVGMPGVLSEPPTGRTPSHHYRLLIEFRMKDFIERPLVA